MRIRYICLALELFGKRYNTLVSSGNPQNPQVHEHNRSHQKEKTDVVNQFDNHRSRRGAIDRDDPGNLFQPRLAKLKQHAG
jgi:hypothetical protein